MQYPRICIVGLKCYDLLVGAESPRYIGGIENQLVLLARGLVARGFPVSFVTFDHDQPDGVEHDGIRIHKAFASDQGIRVVRFVHPRWTGLRSALERANADIYYQMGAGCETGQVAMWCNKNRKHFVFATASDSNCVPGLPSLKGRRERYLFRYGLKNARLVISQTHEQYRLLQKHYGVPSETIRIFTPQLRSEEAALGHLAFEKRWRILWIGRICPEKRPHLLMDISRRLPGYTFDVIGDANADTKYAQDFRRKAEDYSSIILHGKVPRELLAKMYDECKLLVGTSQLEGFPVVFVEAWSRGIPVISTFDPDGVIAEHDLGWHVSSVEEFIDQLETAMCCSKKWRAASKAAQSYYLRNHTVDAALSAYESLFDKLVRG
jgi:glycosyltransferase involved in cell wall biosynthesis